MSAADASTAPGEAVGAIKNAVQSLITALVKIALVGDTAETARWRAEAVAAQKRIAGRVQEISALGLERAWGRAVEMAKGDSAVGRDEIVNPTLPTASPLRPDQLAADPFDLDQAVRTIRDTASFG